MKLNECKKLVGWAALKYIKPISIIGVGTGSTVSYFIDALATIKHKIIGVVSSSESSSVKLKQSDIPVFNLNDVDVLDVYVDGADEVNNNKQMIKGAGGALTREKIIASVALKFVCIVDNTKKVDLLCTNVPLPVEVIPMARSWVAREIIKLGGVPKYRCGVITDNGNSIIDVYNLKILNAIALEEKINNISGVVTVGLFARRTADIVLVGSEHGVSIFE